MCGIAGGIGRHVRAETVATMCATMIHRGPDDQGLHEEPGVVLAMRRLSILDLSPSGHQPMTNERADVWLVFNGEIYNYRSLNQDLISRGHTIRSSGDAETIVHLYEEYGPACIRRLEGMFAFALWDRRAGQLLLGRDRLGIKPLYYAHQGSVLLFASEIKALMAIGEIGCSIDPVAVAGYLHAGSIVGPATLIRQVHALPPGTVAVVTIDDNTLSPQPYWRPHLSSGDQDNYVAAGKVREALTLAVRDHLVSDVGIGVFLSGGIDSTLIAALAARETDGLQSYSIGYDVGGARFDETSVAKRVAGHLGLNHHEHVVSTDHVLEILPRFIDAMDQPSHDGINVYLASELACRYGKVVLSGLGGDELFAGYPTFRFASLIGRLRRYGHLAHFAEPFIEAAHINLPQWLVAQWPWRVARAVARGERAGAVEYWTVRGMFEPHQVERLLNSPDGLQAIDDLYASGQQVIDAAAATTPIDQVLVLELANYLRHTLLPDADSMSMAHSIELRVPFLDVRVVELVLGLGRRVRSRQNFLNKKMLVAAFQDLLPEWVLTRPKQGFAVPLPAWLRDPALREVVEECLSVASVSRRGLFDPALIRAEVSSFYGVRTSSGNQGHLWLRMWMLVVLELWFRSHVDRRTWTDLHPSGACSR